MKRIPQRVVVKTMSRLLRCSDHGANMILSDSPCVARIVSRRDFPVILQHLVDRGYITVTGWPPDTFCIELTASGRVFLEDRAAARRKFLLESIAVPILVAMITTIITVYILPSAGKRADKWLRQTLLRTESPAPASSQADVPSENPPLPQSRR